MNDVHTNNYSLSTDIGQPKLFERKKHFSDEIFLLLEVIHVIAAVIIQQQQHHSHVSFNVSTTRVAEKHMNMVHQTSILLPEMQEEEDFA